MSVWHFLTRDEPLTLLAGVYLTRRVAGSIRKLYKRFRNDKNTLSLDNFKQMLAALKITLYGDTLTEDEIESIFKEIDSNDDGEIDFEEFKHWYLKSNFKLEEDIKGLFQSYKDDIPIEEIGQVLNIIEQRKLNQNEIKTAQQELLSFSTNQKTVNAAQFLQW